MKQALSEHTVDSSQPSSSCILLRAGQTSPDVRASKRPMGTRRTANHTTIPDSLPAHSTPYRGLAGKVSKQGTRTHTRTREHTRTRWSQLHRPAAAPRPHKDTTKRCSALSTISPASSRSQAPRPWPAALTPAATLQAAPSMARKPASCRRVWGLQTKGAQPRLRAARHVAALSAHTV